MATPWKHSDTCVFHIRRQIPQKLGATLGGKALWKVWKLPSLLPSG